MSHTVFPGFIGFVINILKIVVIINLSWKNKYSPIISIKIIYYLLFHLNLNGYGL